MSNLNRNMKNTKDKKLLKDISKYDNIQMAKKISLNSAYGAIGNSYFRYYDLLVAEGLQLLVSCLFVGLKTDKPVYE